ncbi:hypothetical protein KP509_07G074800 [Ceratopteris richardii]|uniref:protein-serine/threonine phosphatase n=2 Tax=Ceratopteris richardii TaxID=49495 RepID=A0A8T2UFX3_CERRI|nr:hypothetical protein KP509_07G074800 [Ceratopteris richardii]KAH7433555.1 hypothetical protein KP509_07G074800 [Ceratopteris richardii]KAH7433556.1 hypothetical protein KP509_07G074800 [Ceratopteris richardii]KAH7433557.1 hypothetical protein KP509_07G074800 [Ceratopteris richardii]KAH7433558.1 hypothetical protein KP509_07G074800 [Ceratopteris richardii]
MGENDLFVVHLYHADKFIGKVTIDSQGKRVPFKPGEDVRISSFSVASDRCFPLVILHTISNEGVLFKMEAVESSATSNEFKELNIVHSSCLKELKTAVIQLAGGVELHLAAMIANRRLKPCFWGFILTPGLYNSCLTMLNLRCLALVFDLDETLIVANTMRSFEDRIDALGSKLKGEVDAQKVSGMSAELKRYMQDRALLRQFTDDDKVWDNTMNTFVTAQAEEVPSAMGGISVKRPIVRLQDRNMVFTRINPNIRDTSVLVRLRPAWEELRSYLTAKGRKRFEVFVCTMSEKEYALEMWRLLDPESQLLSAKEMIDRVVCVKPGSKKSLSNMFANGCCHPKMAMVIDDRLKVWEDRDQPQVHVVPAFAPYYAPQAETNSLVPVLCVARNVACNVRGGFFRDLDETVTRRLAEADFDAEVSTLPQSPIVSNYMIVEEDNGTVPEVANGNKEFPDGMRDSETEKRLSEGIGSSSVTLASVAVENEVKQSSLLQLSEPVTHPLPFQRQSSISEPVTHALLPPVHIEPQGQDNQEGCVIEHDLLASKPLPTTALHLFGSSLQSSHTCEEGEVPESELDPDTRRRLLILQHGQDTQHMEASQEKGAELPFSLQPSLHITISAPAPAGGWLGAEEEISPLLVSKTTSGLVLEPESPSFGKQRSHSPSCPEMTNIDINAKVYDADDKRRPDPMFMGHTFSESDSSVFSSSLNSREVQPRSTAAASAANPVSVLRDIAQKCNTKLEFRSLVNTTKELLFSVEVLFDGEKVGEGIGRTSKEAQQRAADSSLRYMASQFIAHPTNAITALGQGRISTSPDEPPPRLNSRDPRFSAGLGPSMLNEDSVSGVSGQLKFLDFQPLQEPSKQINPVVALKDFCTAEGINVIFKDASSSDSQPQVFVCQVEVAGRVMGKGIGRSWEEAKHQAAEEALRFLKITQQARGPSKRMGSPRSPPLQSNKRMRPSDVSRGLQRVPSPRRPSPRHF